MYNGIIVLLPPILVLISAFILRKLNPSLAIGILSASFIASGFSVTGTSQLAGVRLFNQLRDPDYLYLYGFLLIVGILIVLLNKTGGAQAFAHAITRHIRSKKAAETSSILMSSILFIDDYLSNLTVGYVMRPLTDKFEIPRAKLAFLIHSLSGPLVIMVPVSSWVAMITSQLDLAGIGIQEPHIKIVADPFFVYLNTIPFIFYSILIISSVWFIVRKKISYGPMRTQEKIAQESGNLFGGKKTITEPIEHHEKSSGTIVDLILPLIVLISSVFTGILYVGGFWLFGGNRSLLESFQNNTQTFFALFSAGLITLLFSFVFAYVRQLIKKNDISFIVKNGAILMQGAVLMVFLASTFGTILKHDLQVGTYIAQALIGSIYISLLPLLFFIISTIIATITGSSWGTIAIMTPVTIQMLVTLLHLDGPVTLDQIPILLPILGAVFSGSVCGDHISPISETTIMAATSSGAYPIDHAYTQFFYALPAILSTAVAFLISGLLSGYSLTIMLIGSLLAGLLSCFLLLWYFNRK